MALIGIILSVFSEIGEWFTGMLSDLSSVFFTVSDGVYELTVFGILAVMGLGVGLIMLIFRIVTDFFGWRR